MKEERAPAACGMARPGGEIGRRNGLKIRFSARGVRVQVPPRAPALIQLGQGAEIPQKLFSLFRIDGVAFGRYLT